MPLGLTKFMELYTSPKVKMVLKKDALIFLNGIFRIIFAVKVKCTFVQALRLCTGRTVHRGSRGIGKGKVCRCTGTEVLYRPYGP